MDCDRVFMVLTRGPFPSGDPEDAAVQQHLDGCLDCWRLAEALRPAEHLFQEAVSPAESRDLPGYWGDATPPAVTMARLAQRAARTAIAPTPRRSAQRALAPTPYERTARGVDLIWVVGVLGLVASFVLWAWWLMS